MSKGGNSPKGILIMLPEGITPSEVLEKRDFILGLSKEITGVSRDRSLADRKKQHALQKIEMKNLIWNPK